MVCMSKNWSDKRWYCTVLCCAVLLGTLVSMPYLLHMTDERYQGVPVHFNADEFSYLPRVQEVLVHGTERFGVSIAGGEELLPPLQPGLIEQAYGVLFRPLTQRASTIFTVMDFVMPFLLFIALVGFGRACGLSRKRALVAALLFSFLELYNLGRPIHQRVSFLLTVLSLWGLIQGLEHRRIWGVLGGALMGLLIGTYFWSFTAVWAWWGIALLFFCLRRSWEYAKELAAFGVVGLLCGLPFLLSMKTLSGELLYNEVFFRSGVGHSRVPESLPWSVLFLIMATGTLVLLYKRGRRQRYLACTVAVAFVLLNQHLVHGTLFLFASHYLFFLVFAAVLALVAAWGERSLAARVTAVAAIIFLLGIAYDNRSVVSQWRTDEWDFEEQHLASALAEIAGMEELVILSDPLTSSLIASHTKHDVLFTHYIQHELRSHRELAERYCLTQSPLNPTLRKPEEEHVLVYGAAYDALYNSAEKERIRSQELLLVHRACDAMDRDPRALLSAYGVQYILWDEKRIPQWTLSRLNTPLELTAEGEGWSLWKL